MRGRTAFVIAHRLNTIRNCDVLLVMERGKLKEMVWQNQEHAARPESMEALLRYSPTA
jgi:ATP-binding cassette subfamily B protein